MADNTLGPIIRPVYQAGGGFAAMVSDAKQAAREVDAAFGDGATGRLAKEASSLRAQLDPLYTAQKKFDEEMNRADGLVKHGAITQREYAQAVQLSRDALQQANAAIHGTAGAISNTAKAAGVGTTANHLLVNSTRSLRIATLQAGQQVQDIGISLYSGQRAGVVFAQQLPQLAFALSYLEGSANKTHDRIGRFATFLSGPWGLAVGLAVGVLGQLVYSLFQSGDAADKTASATDRLANKLDLSKNSYAALIAVVNEYNKSQEKTESLTYGAIVAAEKQAKANLDLAKASLLYESTRKPFAGEALAGGVRAAVTDALRQQVAQLEKELNDASRAGANLRVGQRLDPEQAIKDAASLELTRLAERNKRKLIVGKAYEDERFRIMKKAEDDIEAYRKAHEKGRATTNNQYGREIDSAAARAIATAAGFQVNGGDRTLARQKQLYDAWVAQGKPASNPVAYPSANAPHVRGNALDIQSGPGVSPASLRKAYADEGVRLTKILKEDGHFHIEWSTAGADKAENEAKALAAAADRAAEAAKRLAEFGRESGVAIQAMSDRFNDVPQAVLQSRAALEEINDRIGQLNDKKSPDWEKQIKQLEAMKPAAEALADGPFNDMVKASQEQARIQQLLIEGRTVEAEVLSRQVGQLRENKTLTADQLDQLRQMVVQDRLRSTELEKQNQLRQRQVALIDSTKDNLNHGIYDLLKGGGIGAIGNVFKRQWDLVLQNLADSLTESLFGDFFRDQKDKALGFDKVKEASEAQAEVARGLTTDLGTLASAARNAASALDQNSLESSFDREFGTGAANDNNPLSVNVANIDSLGDIVVIGQRKATQELRSALGGLLEGVLGKNLYDKLGGVLQTALKGAAFGQIGGGLVGNPGLGSAIGGALGGPIIGGAIGKLAGTIGGTIGGALGSVAGPLGSILGGVLGGLFSSKPKGSASVTQDGIAQGGNNAGAISQVNSLAGGVQKSIAQMVEALGGTIGNYAFTIGKRKDEFRVSGNSGADVTSKDPDGLIYKGKDEGEAMRAALVNAIQDGAVTGIREGAKRLLQAGQDLEVQLTKALKFQSVFDQLRERKDPLGFALDKLNKEFTGLIAIFREAAATTEEYGELEELYGLRRAETFKQVAAAATQANSSLTASLRDLIKELEVGDSGLSLGDRLKNARAIYDPLASGIRAGQTVDYSAFSAAARDVLEISREIFGSQQEYFATFNDVLGLSNKAIAKDGGSANVTPITDNGSYVSPFTPATAAANNNSGLAAALAQMGFVIAGGTNLADLAAQLAAVNQNMGILIQQGLAAGTILPSYNFAYAGNFF